MALSSHARAPTVRRALRVHGPHTHHKRASASKETTLASSKRKRKIPVPRGIGQPNLVSLDDSFLDSTLSMFDRKHESAPDRTRGD
jgi:hypothetical protein